MNIKLLVQKFGNQILILINGSNERIYIYVRDLESPKNVADYLIYLSINKEEYNKYFKWKKHVKFDYFYPIECCECCIKMHFTEKFNKIEKKKNDLIW